MTPQDNWRHRDCPIRPRIHLAVLLTPHFGFQPFTCPLFIFNLLKIHAKPRRPNGDRDSRNISQRPASPMDNQVFIQSTMLLLRNTLPDAQRRRIPIPHRDRNPKSLRAFSMVRLRLSPCRSEGIKFLQRQSHIHPPRPKRQY